MEERVKQERKEQQASPPPDAGIPTPHDKGYKKSLSKSSEFLHFLQKYIKADWMMVLKESDLSLCDKEMLERDYEGKEADLLYRVVMPDGREVFICILQELQSYVDYTMIFRILVYVVNTLVKYFMDTDKKERERAGFRLPAIVPIVFYNGLERWSAVTRLRDYQEGGAIFGNYILNLEYYLVDLTKIEEEYILSTNTVLDNIMYCDKYRKRMELATAVHTACGRIQALGLQEQEEFRNWMKYILLSVCENKAAVAEELLNWSKNREDDMAFQYRIIMALEEERAEMRAEVKNEVREEIWDEVRKEVKDEVREEVKDEIKDEERAEIRAKIVEDIVELLEDFGIVPEEMKEKLRSQMDLDILRKWYKLAARAQTMEGFEHQISDREPVVVNE